MIKRRIVEVEWIDSASMPGWKSTEEIDFTLKENKECICTSIGYLYKEMDDAICLVSAINHTGEQVDNTFIIPKSVIKSIKKLRAR